MFAVGACFIVEPGRSSHPPGFNACRTRTNPSPTTAEGMNGNGTHAKVEHGLVVEALHTLVPQLDAVAEAGAATVRVASSIAWGSGSSPTTRDCGTASQNAHASSATPTPTSRNTPPCAALTRSASPANVGSEAAVMRPPIADVWPCASRISSPNAAQPASEIPRNAAVGLGRACCGCRLRTLGPGHPAPGCTPASAPARRRPPRRTRRRPTPARPDRRYVAARPCRPPGPRPSRSAPMPRSVNSPTVAATCAGLSNGLRSVIARQSR